MAKTTRIIFIATRIINIHCKSCLLIFTILRKGVISLKYLESDVGQKCVPHALPLNILGSIQPFFSRTVSYRLIATVG